MGKIEILYFEELILLKKIRVAKYLLDKFIIINIYFEEFFEGKKIKIYLLKEFYIIKNLKVNILIGINILEIKGININFKEKKMIILNLKGI